MDNELTIGIYSFPKSGNTWVRQVFAAALNVETPDLDKYITDIHLYQIGKHPVVFGDKTLLLYKSHTDHEIQRVKNDYIIHIRRNPLDVFLSYLNFLSNNVTGVAPIKFESVPDILNTELFEAYFHAFTIMGMLQPTFKPAGNWFTSNKYWMSRTQESEKPKVISIRYEDMIENPIRSFKFLSDWLEIDTLHLQLALSEAENRTQLDGKFFWRRRANSFKDFLSPSQIDFFLDYRGKEAQELGYPAEFFKD